MVTKNEILETLNKMILSASGWRGIFDIDGEEGKTGHISPAYRIISASAALIFAEYLSKIAETAKLTDTEPQKVQILLGSDTRPSNKAIIEVMIPVLLSAGCDICYAGFTAAPEIMAWAKEKGGLTQKKSLITGFIYISASHNPIGHNGIKFGLTDGGVLSSGEAMKLIAGFRSFMERDDCIEKIESLISAADPRKVRAVYDSSATAKKDSYKAYFNFCNLVAFGNTYNSCLSSAVNKLGVVCDFNGSARAASIDAEFFGSLGLVFDCINVVPGEIAHRIVPEGESLEPCRLLLEKAHSRDPAFMLGYVPDCDGDRGNLVIWDDRAAESDSNAAGKSSKGKAHSLEAQDVFALACLAEFCHLVWTGQLTYDDNGRPLSKVAVAINDPTSMRIDKMAEYFGISVFRAEVGEANVVSLARRLRKDGYIVRILGEGSAGGNITHPSAVRDPVHTVLAIVKLLGIREGSEQLAVDNEKGLFQIWCQKSGQLEQYRKDFTLADIISSLPQFVSTPAYSQDAIMKVQTKDHALLKNQYQKIFLQEWEERKDELKEQFDICHWQAFAYNGMEEIFLDSSENTVSRLNFKEAGKGGLKVLFTDINKKPAAYIWMRGSATEPVFRVMADAKSAEAEQLLLKWQRSMLTKADN